MSLLARISLKNRALIALITVVISVFGVFSFSNLKQELIPSLELPQLVVLSSHPGASAEVVANDVTSLVEQAVQAVPGLQGTTSQTSTGLSVVIAEFDFGVDTVNTEAKINQAIGRVKSMLPDNVDPMVLALSLDDLPVVQVSVSSSQSTDLVGDLNRVAVPELERIDGVRAVDVLGAAGQRIAITPNNAALAAAGMDSTALIGTLVQSGGLVSAGVLDDGEISLPAQVGTPLESAEDIAALPLLGSGGLATIGDFATVELTTDPATSYSLVNGETALSLSITKTPDANTVETSHAVLAELDRLTEDLPGLSYTILLDQAPFIEDSINGLASEGLLGLIFAVLIILAFLRSARATLITAISIPLSILVTFIGLQGAGYTVNILTLGGLTIAIGRIVDDSIVVVENIERHMTYGKSRKETIIDAVREVAGAVTAATITTVAVFLPITFVGGMAGVLFQPFALTVTIAMMASLIVSLTIVPVLAYWFLKRKADKAPAAADLSDDDAPAEVLAAAEVSATAAAVAAATPAEATALEVDSHDVGALQRAYRSTLNWVLGHRWITLGAAGLVLVGTLGLATQLTTNFIGDMDQGTVSVAQDVAPGTSLAAQLATAEEVESTIRTVAGVETVTVTVGTTEMSALFGGAGDQISYSVLVAEDAVTTEVSDNIRAALDGVVPEDELTILGTAAMGFSSDVEVVVSGADREGVEAGALQVTDRLAELEISEQVSNSLSEARPTLTVVPDRAALAQTGLTEAQLNQLVSGALSPQIVGMITADSTQLMVYLTPEYTPTTVAEISALPVPGATGLVTLADVATVEVVDGPVAITSVNGMEAVTVTVRPATEDLTVTSAEISAALAELDLPAGVNASLGGVISMQEETFEQLGLAMLVAILVVYVVMVATFRSLLHPLLLLISVPFAATGAILLQLITGVPLGVASLIGVLMLIGIVVTNAIVLIDLVKQYRDRGASMDQALRLGAERRFRPIIMTALATILALLPMAIGVTGHGGFISQPLALVVIGGLFSSTVMTLLVLPAIYHLVEARRKTPVTD